MSEAIEIIASHYVRLKDRVALERMRDHRNNRLQNYCIHAARGFWVESLETALQKDVAALDDALSRLSTQPVPMRAGAKCGRT
jgi:hypothetical protein